MEHQKVVLVGLTKPLVKNENGKELTADEFICYCARVSNPANQLNTSTSAKLVGYLLENAHVSPFEMVSLTMEIKTTRDIGRQILRHRSFSFQEFSQRYAEVAEMITTRETRLQDKKNRQNSIETDDEAIGRWWEDYQLKVQIFTEEIYKAALGHGIAKEQARAVLPEGLTMSTMYMAGTLRSWIHYCQLRMAYGTQKEHMDIASKAWTIICENFPSIRDYYAGKAS